MSFLVAPKISMPLAVAMGTRLDGTTFLSISALTAGISRVLRVLLFMNLPGSFSLLGLAVRMRVLFGAGASGS